MDEETKKAVEEQQKLVEGIRQKWEDVEKGIFTKAEAKEYEEKANARFDELTKEIEEAKKLKERVEAIETKLNRPGNAPGGKDEKSEEVKAFDKWLRTGERTAGLKPSTDKPTDQKALTIGGTSGVSYLAPGEYVQQIIKGVTEISPMRSLADVRTTSNNFTEIPKRTGQFAAAWTTEVGSKTETTGLTYGMETIPNHEMYALVKVSNHSLEDSAFNLEAEISSEIAEQFAKAEGAAFITGNGVGKPEGFTVNADVNKSTVVYDVSDTAIIVDGVIDLLFAPKGAYARVGRLLCNRVQIAYLRKYKDATSGLYYWEPDGQAGTPGRFMGVPIVEVPDMANPGDGAYSMAFGDFRRGYVISDRVQISIQRLTELYAESNQVGFLARKRVGGQVVLAEAIYVGVGQS